MSPLIISYEQQDTEQERSLGKERNMNQNPMIFEKEVLPQTTHLTWALPTLSHFVLTMNPRGSIHFTDEGTEAWISITCQITRALTGRTGI